MSDRGGYFMRANRIGFRRWREDDMDFASMLWGDVEVTRLIDSRGKLSEAQICERLVKEMATEREHGVQYWPIFLLDNDEFIGCCGLRPYDVERQVYETGVHIRSAHWRHGYALEAARAAIHYAFDTLKATSLFAGHNPTNDASRQLLRKLGFHYTHDEYYPPTGLDHPSYEFGIETYKFEG